MTCWCVYGAKHICVGAVGVNDVWVVCVGVDVTWYEVAPNTFDNLCKAFSWRPWGV